MVLNISEVSTVNYADCSKLFIKTCFICISALEYKIKAREKMYNDLMEQIRRREDFLNSMAKEEEILEKTFRQAAQAELEKELASRKDYRVRRGNYFKNL
jgi:hypothetical protein